MDIRIFNDALPQQNVFVYLVFARVGTATQLCRLRQVGMVHRCNPNVRILNLRQRVRTHHILEILICKSNTPLHISFLSANTICAYYYTIFLQIPSSCFLEVCWFQRSRFKVQSNVETYKGCDSSIFPKNFQHRIQTYNIQV